MTNTQKVLAAYLADPMAYADEIAERVGLTKKQVQSARSTLVGDGRLPHMYGFMGALHQTDPNHPYNEILKLA